MSTAVDAQITEIPDLTDPATFHRGLPYEAYDALLSRPGLHWHPTPTGTKTGGLWIVTRYREVTDVLQKPDLFSSVPGPFFPFPNLSGDGPMSKHILFMDPPEHSRVRRTAARSFGPRVVANFESWITDVVVETLDEALPRGEFDWVNEVARLIPSRVIAKILGVSDEERGFIVDSADQTFVSQTKDDGGAGLAEVYMRIGQFFDLLGQEKLRNPADDMTTVLAQALANGDIDAVEYGHYTGSLLVAGFETTHTAIGHIARLLATNAQIRDTAWLALERGHSAELADEFVRYITPIMTQARTSTQDQVFHGQQIAKDDGVLVIYTAANRDPRAFEHPHQFDPYRAKSGTIFGTGGSGLAFGGGPHRCIGHALARLELKILLEEMYRRGVGIELTGEPTRGYSTLVNQMLALPVRVSTSKG